MKKKQIFDNARVTELLKKYVRHKSDKKLRNKIVRLSLPLVDAAISRKRLVYQHRDDIHQECALKVLQAVSKFDPKKGKAFAFLWTVICNTCLTHSERLGRHGLSLSSDEDVQREAEASAQEVFQTPENQHILNSISKSIGEAFEEKRFPIPRKRLHRKACMQIQRAIASGEFFFNRTVVMRKLKDIGLEKREIQFYCQRSLIVAREKLLIARENARAIDRPKISKAVSTVTDS